MVLFCLFLVFRSLFQVILWLFVVIVSLFGHFSTVCVHSFNCLRYFCMFFVFLWSVVCLFMPVTSLLFIFVSYWSFCPLNCKIIHTCLLGWSIAKNTKYCLPVNKGGRKRKLQTVSWQTFILQIIVLQTLYQTSL